jgi:hypothetical protein
VPLKSTAYCRTRTSLNEEVKDGAIASVSDSVEWSSEDRRHKSAKEKWHKLYFLPKPIKMLGTKSANLDLTNTGSERETVGASETQ